MEVKGRWLLVATGTAVVVYSIAVLCFISTSPDLRIRCLLENENVDPAAPAGVEIRATPRLGQEHQGLYPRPGDVLVRVGEEPIRSFLDFSRQWIALYNAEIGRDAHLHAGSDPSELDAAYDLPKLVEIEGGPRMVQIEYWKPDTKTFETSWLALHSPPIEEITLSLFWFLLQLGVVIIAALAFWHRPFDRPIRLFFGLSMAAMGTFAAGHHWWVVAGSLWLLLPFVVCAALLPALILHFFLVYPRPKLPISRYPYATMVGLYAPPLLAVFGLLLILSYADWLSAGETAEARVALLHEALGLLRTGVYGYLAVAGFYFAASIVGLGFSYFGGRTPIERGQVRWMLWGGLGAAVPVGYAAYLAQADPVRFALGGATLPMFLASVAFMLAYLVGIIRYKLMLIDQIVSRGVVYYALSIGLAIAFGLAVAAGSVLLHLFGKSASTREMLKIGALEIPQHVAALGALLIVSIMLLLWLRDLFQRMIDQRFFREKYQLDRALSRMNQAVGRLAEPESLGEMMLTSCRDVLGVDRAALYWRGSFSGPFQLVAAEGGDHLPINLSVDEAFLQTLSQGGSLQRTTAGTRGELSPAQNLLRSLQADLVHGLEAEEGIVALILLGGKKHKTPFTAEDVTFLHTLGQITKVAFHSVRVHQNLTRLNDELQLKVERIGEQRRQIAMLKAELSSTQKSNGMPAHSEQRPPEVGRPAGDEFRREAIKGDSPAIRNVLATVRKIAASESSVLILGESGTGKELLAHSLHENSLRRAGAMICVHCAALAPTLLESELFGHVKGAFTGAHRDKVGRFEAADGGTLFLDEIGDVSLETQVKLLRVLQERRFEPVGGTRTIQANVRLITATNQNLERLIEQGQFREDLYYRLNVISITMPALRERVDDVFELALHFLDRASRRLGKTISRIDAEALAALERYHWPGNVRELENAIERAVVLADGEAISLGDLPAEVASAARRLPRRIVETKPTPLTTAADGDERELLAGALRQCGGNKAEAARMLGMPRSTYYSKLTKYKLG